MDKKVKISVVAAAVLLVAALFCTLVPCVAGLTLYQTASVKSRFKTNPFMQENTSKRVIPAVAAAVGSDGYERNTFIGSRIQMEDEPNYIEVNLASNADGKLVLADSYFDANEKSVDVYRVARSLIQNTKSPSLLVNLAEYTDLNAVSALLLSSSRFANAAVRGVDENTIAYVSRYFPSNAVLCEYSAQNKLSLTEIKAKGADGVYCSASMLSARFAKKVHDAGLQLWIDCGSSAYRVVKTMSMAQYVDGMVTAKPSLALNLEQTWSYDSFRQLNR